MLSSSLESKLAKNCWKTIHTGLQTSPLLRNNVCSCAGNQLAGRTIHAGLQTSTMMRNNELVFLVVSFSIELFFSCPFQAVSMLAELSSSLESKLAKLCCSGKQLALEATSVARNNWCWFQTCPFSKQLLLVSNMHIDEKQWSFNWVVSWRRIRTSSVHLSVARRQNRIISFHLSVAHTGLIFSPRRRQISTSSYYSNAAPTPGLHQLFSFICCSQGLFSPAICIVPPHSPDYRARKPPAMGEVPTALLRTPCLSAPWNSPSALFIICCSQGLLSPAVWIVPPTPPTTGLANPQQWAKCPPLCWERPLECALEEALYSTRAPSLYMGELITSSFYLSVAPACSQGLLTPAICIVPLTPKTD